jgi:hypothetical protein
MPEEAAYEPPQVTDLGSLEELTKSSTGLGPNEMNPNKT